MTNGSRPGTVPCLDAIPIQEASKRTGKNWPSPVTICAGFSTVSLDHHVREAAVS